MDILMEGLNPDYCNLEIDVFWVEWADINSVKFMEKWVKRSPYIHFKDMIDKESKKDIEVGHGIIDMMRIAELGKENEAEWFIVEQEEFNMPSIKSAEISYKNLKRILDELH